MRRGELLALRWSDLDLEAGSLQARRTVSYIAVDEHHEFRETEPKTAAGKRTIPLPRMVVEALKHHRRSQLEARLQPGQILIWFFPIARGTISFPAMSFKRS
jgi:integrase